MMAGEWRQRSAVFGERAAEYDQWYEGSPLFAIELEALTTLLTPLDEPALEIGVGPGRFAAALRARFGLDPAWAPLALARQRGVAVCQGVGEQLPYRANVFGALFCLFTLCFLARPQAVFVECARVLRPGGHLVLGMVPAASLWGKALNAKREAGHPFYRHAHLYEVAEAERFLAEAGFVVVERRSTLCQEPGAALQAETAQAGVAAQAGFVVLVGRRER